VTLITRAAGSQSATKWESAGNGSYTIEAADKPTRGTTILLKLKKAEQDEADFTEEWTLRGIVKKHSDFVAYPVVMDVEKTEPVLDADGKPVEGKTEKVIREET
jgi:molecular chaperone HtpG